MYLGEYQTPERMATKRAMLPPLDLDGRTLLDVGCDHGAWCWWAAEQGASSVLGLDRGRDVRGEGWVDLAERNAAIAARAFQQCRFRRFELGRQWHEFGQFDVVLMLSMYHHVYEIVADHRPIWYWLWRHTKGELIWENPVNKGDAVAARHVTHQYEEADIRYAAERWFHVEQIGQGHIPTRVVWRCIPREFPALVYDAAAIGGAGGATRAFLHDDGLRIVEIHRVLDIECYPGSLNLQFGQPFPWDMGYYRSQILDVVDRRVALDQEWRPRWARFYPIRIADQRAYLFRFENEDYPLDFGEVIAHRRLRDMVADRTSFRTLV